MTENTLSRKQESLFLLTIMLGELAAVLNMTTVNIALPNFIQYFHTDMLTAQWLVVGYLLSNSLIMPMVGYLGDKFSYRNVFAFGLVLLAVTSFGCAMAANITWLIICRISQGLAGGLLLPASSTLVYQFIPKERQLIASSMVTMISSAGAAFGPAIAGILIAHFGWQGIFWFNVPIAFLDLLLLARFIPYKTIATGARLDWLGGLLAFIGTLGVLLSCNMSSKLGWHTFLLWGSAALSMGFLIGFVAYELRTHAPMLNFTVFRYKLFRYSFIFNAVTAIATYFTSIYMSLFLQSVLGLDALHTGFALLFPALVMAIASPITSKLAKRYSQQFLLFAGIVLLTIGTFALSRFSPSTTLAFFTIWLSLRYFGLGMVIPLSANFGMSAVPPHLLGHASAMLNWGRQLVSTLATSLFAVIYSNRLLHHTALSAARSLENQQALNQSLAINDINFYCMLLLLPCIPLVYCFTEKHLHKAEDKLRR